MMRGWDWLFGVEAGGREVDEPEGVEGTNVEGSKTMGKESDDKVPGPDAAERELLARRLFIGKVAVGFGLQGSGWVHGGRSRLEFEVCGGLKGVMVLGRNRGISSPIFPAEDMFLDPVT